MRQEIKNTNAIATQLNYSHAGNSLTIWDSDRDNLLTQLSSNPNYSNFSYSAKINSLTVHWLVADGPQIDRLLRPDGLIEPRTSEYLHQGKILSLWISKSAAQPIKFGEILMLRLGGYRYQSLDLLQAFGAVPAGKDTRLYARVENVGSGYLGPGDEVVLQGEVEEVIAYEDNRESQIQTALAKIETKIDNLNIEGGGGGVIQGSGLLGVIDAGEAFRWRHVDGRYTWNNVAIFAPTTTTSTGIIKLGPFTLKNKLIINLAGALSSGSKGSSFLIKIKNFADDSNLISTTAAALGGTDRSNGSPGQAIEIDTSAHTGIESYLEAEITSDYTTGLTFVALAHEVIIY